MSAKKNTMNFEASIERLQQIVEKLDSEEILLDQSIQLYEEGIEIIEKCVNELSGAQKKFKELRKRADGILELMDISETT